MFVTQVEPRVAGGNVELEGELSHSLAPFREACSSPFLVAGGHSRGSAIAAVSSRQAGVLHLGYTTTTLVSDAASRFS
jgi:hypothetical protein